MAGTTLSSEIWAWLTRPAIAITEEAERRQAQFLSSVLLLLVLLGFWAGLVPYALTTSGPLFHSSYGLVIGVSECLLIVMYLLSRTRYYELAAFVTLCLTSLGIYVIARNSRDASLLAFLILPVLLSSMLLQIRSTALLASLQMLGLGILHQTQTDIMLPGTWFAFVVVTSSLVLAVSYHRALVERDRQAKLAASELRYRAISELSYDYAYALVIGADGKVRCDWVTEAFTRITGYTLDEVLQDTVWKNVCHPDDLARSEYQMRKRLSGQATTYEFRFLTRDGGIRWLRDNARPEWDDSQQRVVRIVGAAQDITQQKRSGEERRRYIKRLGLLHAIGQGVLAGLASPEVARIALEGLHNLIGCCCASVILFEEQAHQAYVLSSIGAKDDLFQTGRTFSATCFKPADSQHVPQFIIDDLTQEPDLNELLLRLREAGVRTYVSTPLTIQDEVIGVLAFGGDTPFAGEHLEVAWELANQLATAIRHTNLRQQIEKQNVFLTQRVERGSAELSRATERVEAILNNSGDGIILAHPDGSITQTNPAFDRLSGYQPDELYGRPLSALVHPDYAAALMASLETAVAEQTVSRLEVEFCGKDGSLFSADISLAPLQGNTHYRSSIVCTVHDVTPRKQAEAELRNALEKEKELGELKTRFVSMASHEFRTPLTTIASSVDLLDRYLDKMDPQQKQQHFVKLHEAVKYMTDLLEDVLIYGRAETNRLVNRPTPMNLESLCRTVIGELQPNADSSLEIVFSCKGPCEDVVLDENLMRHILVNLVSNALKYSPQGGSINVDVTVDTNGTTVQVSDQGIGIPEQDRARLYQPFYRADNVGTIKGTGLGLSILQRAVTLQNGTVTCQSKEGVGTTFTVVLPSQ